MPVTEREEERDVESLYDYFGARYYDSRIGRFLAVDPLVGSISLSPWSPYHYSFNNPLRFIDPSGTIPGEYYDENGKKIGDDNTPDKKVYVTDKQTIAANTKDGKTDWAAVQGNKGTVLLPTAETRIGLGEAIQEATPNNEVGGLIATTPEGNEKILNAKPGAPANPSKDNEASINVWDLKNPSDISNVKEIKGPFHTHPSGTEKIGNTTYSFIQSPSEKDKSNMVTYPYTGNGYVFGMGDKKVYIYNGGGPIRTVPTSFFTKP